MGELPALHKVLQYRSGRAKIGQYDTGGNHTDTEELDCHMPLAGRHRSPEKTDKLLAAGAVLPVLAGSGAASSAAILLDRGVPVNCF